ncbi:MAG: GTP-binding protein, partial [Clostridiales bacterium]|nr:GTP-binding protein [Clostridiales bacterium]
MERQELIRNFCIIAHIDHGKSTLADRLIEHTGVVEKREMQSQILDNMDIERERGITIKSQATRMAYKAQDGNTYMLNLIDTPGHVDFNYEVSRSLAACDGAVLIVDAAQGVEAQTLANVYLAVDADLEVLPVINKIDLPSARPEEVRNEIEDDIGIDASYAPLISAKNDIGIDDVLEGIVKYLPPPHDDEEAPLRALIFDSKYDPYKGVIVSVRVKEGRVRNGDRIRMMHTGKEFTVTELGYFHPGEYVPTDALLTGEVGYICASIKNVSDTAPGDTVTLAEEPAEEPLKGYKSIQQMVFCGIYPVDGARYGDLRDALEKLRLNDAALSFEAET